MKPNRRRYAEGGGLSPYSAFDYSGVGGAMPEAYGANVPVQDPLARGLMYAAPILAGGAQPHATQAEPKTLYKTARPYVNITDQDIDNAIQIGLGVSGGGLSTKGIRAYHGSPHDFNKFDLSKIGTGEGAQAYGHGLYFAEAEKVAQQYRDQLKWKGANFDDHQVIAQNAIDRLGDRAAAADSLESAMKSTTAFYRGKMPAPQEAANEMTAKAVALLRSKEPVTGVSSNPGRMYEVNISADPTQFLNWDKPLIEQGAVGKRAFEAIHDQPLLPPTVVNGAPDAGKWVRGMQSINGPEKFTSQLNEAGIPGIKYLDQGSRGAGEGSSNFVVFNDKLIDILRKYGIAGAAPVAGAAAINSNPAPEHFAFGGMTPNTRAPTDMGFGPSNFQGGMQPMGMMQPQMPMMGQSPQQFANGGGLGAGTPYTTPPQSSPLPKGLIASPVAGRTDSIEVTAKPGSFIFPADVVSGLGQGNTLAGERILDSLLKGDPKMSKPMKPRSKGLRRFADGGATQEVPIIVAGGEYSVGPEEVIAVGGGDYDKGHKILSNMVVGVREQVINQLEKLPGPVK